jgi:hypothetical protein
MAERMQPRRAARFLFAIRLFPSTIACLLVAALCVPSFIWLEPVDASEGVGFICLAAAAMGAAVWGISLARGLRAIANSAQFLRGCHRPGKVSPVRAPDKVSPVWEIEMPAPLVALAGVIRPRFVVSSQVLTVLTPGQLELALLHERAHRVSHDNLKRLLVILTPDLIPFVNPWKMIERTWAKFTEWAADDDATGGDSDRSLSLAATLVCVARTGLWQAPLIASLVDHRSADLLAARVDRLLYPAPPRPDSSRRLTWLVNGSITAIAGAIVLLALNPSVLSFVHAMMERLID